MRKHRSQHRIRHNILKLQGFQILKNVIILGYIHTCIHVCDSSNLHKVNNFKFLTINPTLIPTPKHKFRKKLIWFSSDIKEETKWCNFWVKKHLILTCIGMTHSLNPIAPASTHQQKSLQQSNILACSSKTEEYAKVSKLGWKMQKSILSNSKQEKGNPLGFRPNLVIAHWMPESPKLFTFDDLGLD